MHTDTTGKKLAVDQQYLFNFDAMGFSQQNGAPYAANHIKFLRLALAANTAHVLAQVQNHQPLSQPCLQLARPMLSQYLRL